MAESELGEQSTLLSASSGPVKRPGDEPPTRSTEKKEVSVLEASSFTVAYFKHRS